MLLRYWILSAVAVVSPAQTFTTLASFNGINGSTPVAPLIQGSDGNFYGTTEKGGTTPTGSLTVSGTIFKITPGGTLTTLYSFTGAGDGSQPYAGLLQGNDGNFYGTTFGVSRVFKITPTGTMTTLYSFANTTDGTSPRSSLIQAPGGNFYGTTSAGSGFDGSVFKLTPNGVLTTLYSFTDGADGGAPYAGLVEGSDGNFYGTTYQGGGSSNVGTIFKITPGGTLTTLYSFSGNAVEPQAGLIQGTDGNFYGTTSGGATGTGTVFKITSGGTLTTLHSFTAGADGGAPLAGLIQATDGNFYGTTSAGGANRAGTIFEITSGGTLTTLHSFTGADGMAPQAALVQGNDGNLYGTTPLGGASGDGTVFELQLGLPSISLTPAITVVQNAEGGASLIAPNTWVTLKGSNLGPAGDTRTWMAADFGVNGELPTTLDGVSVTINSTPAYIYYISPTQVNVLTAPGALSGTIEVVLTNGPLSASFSAQGKAESPSFFVFNGGPYIAATHLNGGLIGSTSLYPGSSTPAVPGETIVLYANGFGPTDAPVIAGAATQSGILSPLPVVTVGGVNATVLFAGLVSPGEFQFNVVLPSSLSAADQPVTATYNGLTTQAGALITVQ